MYILQRLLHQLPCAAKTGLKKKTGPWLIQDFEIMKCTQADVMHPAVWVSTGLHRNKYLQSPPTPSQLVGGRHKAPNSIGFQALRSNLVQ